MNVVLIGFSGSGKSTVGVSLARRLGWEFVDTDREVEGAAGKPIHRIFAEQGEAAFRSLEREAVLGALRGGPRVVAVGGGAVIDPVNRQAMVEGNLIVLLDAEVDTLHRRLAADVAAEPRPLLEEGDPQRRIAALKAARDPIYVAAAHWVVRTDGVPIEEVAEQVCSLVLDRMRAAP